MRRVGESAISKIQHVKKLSIMGLFVGSGSELVPGTLDNREYAGETELARIDSIPPSRHTHHRPYKVIGGNGHQDLLLHPVRRSNPDVL